MSRTGAPSTRTGTRDRRGPRVGGTAAPAVVLASGVLSSAPADPAHAIPVCQDLLFPQCRDIDFPPTWPEPWDVEPPPRPGPPVDVPTAIHVRDEALSVLNRNVQ